MEHSMSNTVLILGASGKIGSHASDAFRAAGWTVRAYDRKSGNMTRAADGADVIVNGLNPPAYHDWQTILPRITAEVIAAAKASGAAVILPGNVYNFGDTPGTWSETTPQRPVSRKGRLRVEAEQAYEAAGVQTIVLRAGNIIDPRHQGDVMSALIMRGITGGKLTTTGRADVMQAYAYLPDLARAMVALAEIRARLSRFEDVPFPGHAFTVTQLRDTLETALSRRVRITGFPWWLMTLAAPFWELARELREMRYLWNTGHQLSGEKFRHLLPGFRPTPLREAMLSGLPADIHPDQPVARSHGHVPAE